MKLVIAQPVLGFRRDLVFKNSLIFTSMTYLPLITNLLYLVSDLR